ncbi:lambda-crystallin homolog isoform X2 [Scyliorhinus canicula]|uniref:lambda-crystallin homolog isoform X2 n=1 Tax=Scyliorhinus canicula TaxID=7830 RepID=UPI0018F61666|nr:lambda-crystallin homolog isoform X2 [Scyliorhinus canicula]
MTDRKKGNILIVGSGLIGQSWAMLFASAGYRITLYDTVEQQVTRAIENIRQQLIELEGTGMLRGALKSKEQMLLISACSDLVQAVEGAIHIQVNPPYYVPLVELVPHPETHTAVLEQTYALMKDIGQSPVKLAKEIDGFVLNRIQYAIIAESWRLVNDGILSPEDVDLVMSSGLGTRYAFMGPFETIHLNAKGLKNYCESYDVGMKRVLSSFGPVPEFSGETMEKIDQAMSQRIPPDPESLNARRQCRDSCLAALTKLKMDME